MRSPGAERAHHQGQGQALGFQRLGARARRLTGGLGENAAVLRSRIVGAVAWMGLALDAAANAAGERRINSNGSKVQLRVMRTNEEAVIARHAFQVGTLSAKR